MKKFISKFTAVFILAMAMTLGSAAQVIIKVRPGAPVMRARPAMPGPKYVWVHGDYVYRGNQYVYNEGYWAVPPPRRSHWVEGKWKHRRGGWVWIPGHWR